ncbi:MAG: sigma-70 family RNA polymerase sigma factor [Acidobacteria bacterium]|nr:sigma-70 family RNA polymerase sigma factor [Acidobacteriota bacterium]
MGNTVTAKKLADAHTAAGMPPEFAELYESHYTDVFRAALRVTGNPADAEDALQTVFLRILGVLAQGGELPDARNPQAWFRRAACNAAIDILRRRTVRAEVSMDDVPLKLVKKPEALLKEQLRRAIAALDPKDAELFLLRYVEGFSNGELADLLRQEKNNIAVRLHRIRQTLQTILVSS